MNSNSCSCSCSSTFPTYSCFWQDNNMGVYYLNKGDYQGAFHCFRSALTCCKSEVDDCYYHHRDNNDGGSSRPTTVVVEEEEVATTTTTTEAVTTAEETTVHQEVAAGRQLHATTTTTTTAAAVPTTIPTTRRVSFTTASSCCCNAIEGCIRNGTAVSLSPFSSTTTIINKDSMMRIHACGIPTVPQQPLVLPATTTTTTTNSTVSSNGSNSHSSSSFSSSTTSSSSSSSPSSPPLPPWFFSLDPFQDRNICSAMIVFNFGLLFHLQGLQEGIGCHRHLTNALSLYQQASQLLSTTIQQFRTTDHDHGDDHRDDDTPRPRHPAVGVGVTATGNASVDLLYLALINNSADLSMVLLADPNITNRLFRQLIDFSRSVRQSSILYYQRSQGVAVSMNQRVDSFLFNATFAQMHPISSAPAA